MVEQNLPEPQAALPPLRPEPPKPKRQFGQWFLLVAAVIALAAAIVFLVLRFIDPPAQPGADTVERNQTPGLDGVIAENMPPEQLVLADCLRGFKSPLDPQTVVTCESSHNAQLIGSFDVEEGADAEYPGPEELLARSEDLCKSVALDPSAGIDSTWTYHFSRPSKGTWAEGDRTITCFLSLSEGNIRTSLLPATDSDSADSNSADASKSSTPEAKEPQDQNSGNSN